MDRFVTACRCLLAACFVFFSVGNLTVDLFMGFDVCLLSTGWAYHQLVYNYGETSDPLFLANSPYFRYSALVTAIVYFPYYILMIFQLVFYSTSSGELHSSAGGYYKRILLPCLPPQSGIHPCRSSSRLPLLLVVYSWLFVVGMGANMTVVLGMEMGEWLWDTSAAPRLLPMLATVGLYWVVPLLMGWMLIH